LPIFDGGNMTMQRHRVKSVFADENFNPRGVMDDESIYFQKPMAATG
jgi:nitroalkane oxidase